jgi:hypothetical protein
MARFEIGTKIRVDITARVTGAKKFQRLNTTAVTQPRNGGWEHFLFLDSGRVTGNKEFNGTVRAQFDAVVTGEFENEEQVTTKVRETGSGIVCTHYLFLDSPEISVITDDEPTTAGSTREIGPDEIAINSDAVANRIKELSNRESTWNVVRLRNNEVMNLTPFTVRDDAVRFIDERDYNPARVTVRLTGIGDAGSRELDSLRELQDKVVGVIRQSTWTVYGAGYFTARWVRGQVMDELGVTASALDRWPLNELDWEAIAVKRQEDRFPNAYNYRGATFRGSD